jgi:hypothetical protein
MKAFQKQFQPGDVLYTHTLEDDNISRVIFICYQPTTKKNEKRSSEVQFNDQSVFVSTKNLYRNTVEIPCS